MKINALLLFLTLVFTFSASAEDFMPSTIFQLDKKFTHHVIVVEKATHTLFLYQYDNQVPKLIKKYQIATGKKIGNKLIQGDKRTPEGIYFFQKFHSADNLIEKYGKTGLIYGAGAFTLNYPNVMDRRNGKTGGGIWLHSTDDDARVSKGLDSRGCVVAIDSDLKDISQYIDLENTPAIIVQNLNFITKETWLKNRDDVSDVITKWSQAWTNKDFDNYISSYSTKEFFSSSRGGFRAYKNYKRRVFSRKDKPVIDFRNISILHNGDYVIATMEQDYYSPIIKDIGKKTLYLKKNEHYEWKIIHESFQKLDANRNLAFTPSMRFFSENRKEEIANDSESI